MATNILDDLIANEPKGEFRPYCVRHEAADAMTIYLKDEPDYSKRLTDHVTLYLSVATQEPVGFRIKNVNALLQLIPNFIDIKHGKHSISILLLPLAANEAGQIQDELNKLGRIARESPLMLDECLAG